MGHWCPIQGKPEFGNKCLIITLRSQLERKSFLSLSEFVFGLGGGERPGGPRGLLSRLALQVQAGCVLRVPGPQRGCDCPEHRPLGLPPFLWTPLIQRNLEAPRSAPKVLTATHTCTHTHTHTHTYTLTQEAPQQGAKKVSLSTSDSSFSSLATMPFRDTCGPPAAR